MKHPSHLLPVPPFLLALAACESGGVHVDTAPIGGGLAVVGIGIVLAAWVLALFGNPGGDK